MRLLPLIFFALLSGAAACSAPSPTPAPSPVRTPPPAAPTDAAPTRTWTPVPTPTRTQRPTRTPRPSPTLPPGADFACLPVDGARQSGVVAGVVDGDTIRVQIGPQNFTVRYIGVDTPETNMEPPEPFGPEATARNRALVSGERVILVSDPGVGETDIFNRLLRYVIAGDIFVNAALVREGFARYSASPGAACGSLMFSAEQAARSAKAGLWGPAEH